ncbi:alpha/beta-hydrolase [Wolfiporia cocos MD-104 SS10]|uniref:Alpha/beta-hydrolase n=1 Tax=Wolfiporia cocos (strain MD-104) TaxID=742152 RepID=A0A2H3J1M7_WOLCO|nr:alpha/beta-hydrolase [Wolfiporia cocos MD-104 SS10]
MVYKALTWLALTTLQQFRFITSDSLPDSLPESPTIALPYGNLQGSTLGDVSSFLGIPYAQPPLGDLRFAPPQPPLLFKGVAQATEFGPACPQQIPKLPNVLPFNVSVPVFKDSMSEDCLFINVYKPASARAQDKLPVVFWIFGGAFEFGDAALYPATAFVKRSMELGEPVIFVSHNYRVNAFGFLASQEVVDAGHTNIGLRDRHNQPALYANLILCCRWGTKLGFLESGTPAVLQPYTEGGPYYDVLVEHAGIMAGVNATPNADSYRSMNLAWQPRLDADMTDAQFLKYVRSTYMPAATSSDLQKVSKSYPSDPGEGSPFGTGDLYALTPQYKRIAAFTGDWEFVAPHRFWVEHMSRTQDTWAYLFNRMKSTPFLGAVHSSDVTEFFGDRNNFPSGTDRCIDFAATDAIINFANHLNPNAPAGLPSNVSFLSKVSWDKWSEGTTSHPFLLFLDPAPSLGLSYDMYRADALALLNRIALKMP